MSIDIDKLADDRAALTALVADYERLKSDEESVFLKGALNISRNLVAIYTPDGKLCHINEPCRAVFKQFGYEPTMGITHETLISEVSDHVPLLTPEEKRQEWIRTQLDLYREALETGQPIEISRTGGIYNQVSVQRTESGHIVDTRIDITEMHERRTDIEMLLENSDQGIIFVDREKRIEIMNIAFRRIFGLDSFKLTPTSKNIDIWRYIRSYGKLSDVYKDDEAWEQYMISTLSAVEAAKEKPTVYEIFPGEFVKFSVRDFRDGRQLFCVTDVTEQLERQKALEAETIKAQAAEVAKSEFLANMSHEIRTPMNGVMGMAELLMATELDARQRTFADTILKSGEALLTIINDILDFSKIDAGQVELRPAPFELRDAIEDVVTLLAPHVASKDLEVAVRISPNLPEMLVGDVGRIRQVVTNLVGNAVKFTEKGQVVVDVSGDVTETSAGADASLAIRIEDTGIGIPADKCETIFDKFSQVDASAARAHEGTGLGLSITSSLVKLMGGSIDVESEVGTGSVFTLRVILPVHGEAKPKRVPPVDVSGARLLIVDDNAVNRSILLEQTKSWNFVSKAVESGAKAFAILDAAITLGEPFDLIVLDYHMPEMTGADFVEKLRSDERFQTLPVVMLTSVEQTEDGRAFEALGIQGHLTKPARSSLLMDRIVEALQPQLGDKRAVAPDVRDGMKALQDAIEKNIDNLRSIVRDNADPAFASHQNDALDVLVAEDNEVNQIVFTQTLEELGVNFEIVGNGVLAVDAFQAKKPRLVLMDISMPEMNGVDATAKIREIENTAVHRTPVIAVTAHAMTGDREKYLECGMDDYLSKPISPAKLRALVKKWLRAEVQKSA